MIISTASAASSSISSSFSRSPLEKSSKTKLDALDIGCSGCIPIRTRVKSCVFKQSMIDLSPFCPPCEPRGRIRIFPNGRARSSEITISSVSTLSGFETRQLTASPLKFINVCGLTSSTAFPPMCPRPTNARHSALETFVCSRWARRSTSMNPALCLVRSYLPPGFPSPTMSRLLNVQVPQLTFAAVFA